MNLHRTWNGLALSDHIAGIYCTGRNAGAAQFRHLCNSVREYVMRELADEHADSDYGTDAQHGALLGRPDSVRYFKSKIGKYLKEKNIGNVEYPRCFTSVIEALYHEIWGYSVVAEWFNMPDCQSAKVIGEQVFYMVEGRMVLQPLTLPSARREQLINSLLLNTPAKTRAANHVEMNLVTGERITIFSNSSVKPGRETIVFRKYTVKTLTWAEQARLGTIHPDSVRMMEQFSRVGFNTIFTGPVRSGKTTLLETWQSYEDPSLEGCALEMTDEIKFHRLLPGSPIMELITSDDEDVGDITKPVLRSDADYLVLAEARSGREFDLMVRLANKGTNRCKTTLHTTSVAELIYDITDEIMSVRPNARYETTLMKTAKAYHYIIQLAQLYHDKSQKRVTGIYEICADRAANKIEMVRICEYNFERDNWSFGCHIGEDKRDLARRENNQAFKEFETELQRLAAACPMDTDGRIAVYDGGTR